MENKAEPQVLSHNQKRRQKKNANKAAAANGGVPPATTTQAKPAATQDQPMTDESKGKQAAQRKKSLDNDSEHFDKKF